MWSALLAPSNVGETFLGDGRYILFNTPQGLVRRDVETGAIEWQTDYHGRIHTIHGEFAYCCEITGPCEGNNAHLAPYRLTAIAVDTGRAVLQVDLPSYPLVLKPVGELVMANQGLYPDYPRWARWFAPDGRIVFSIDDYAFASVRCHADMIALTSSSILRLRPLDAHATGPSEVAWRVDPGPEWKRSVNAAGGLVADDHVLVFGYHRIADSGIWLLRLEGTTGSVDWTRHCQSLGVVHSQYLQSVEMRLVPQGVEVTSVGERTFVEVVDLATGSQVSRTVMENEPERQ